MAQVTIVFTDQNGEINVRVASDPGFPRDGREATPAQLAAMKIFSEIGDGEDDDDEDDDEF